MFEPKDRMSSRRQYGVTCNVLCHIDYTSFPLTYNVYKALFNLGLILNNIVPRSEEDIYDVALGYLQVNLIELIRLDLLRRTFREYSGPDLIIERPETLLFRHDVYVSSSNLIKGIWTTTLLLVKHCDMHNNIMLPLYFTYIV